MSFLNLASILIHVARISYFVLKLITRCSFEPTCKLVNSILELFSYFFFFFEILELN